MADVPDILVLAGPTASGKTEAGIALARALGGEIVSADARQIFRYMDIGTAKPTPGEQQAARHHLIDVTDPDDPYSAGRYAREAATAVREVLKRSRFPILVGGSGLYLQALLDGFAPIPEIPRDIRADLQREAGRDLSVLYCRLQEIDPDIADRLHPHDTQRIVRALEVYETTGTPLSVLQRQPRKPAGRWQARWFGLAMDRSTLYGRIEVRVDRMLSEGLVEEVKYLRERGYGPDLNALNTFGYREIFSFLNGQIDLKEAAEQIKLGTRRYAKRQLTWFRREARITWADPTKGDATAEILKAMKGRR